MIHEKLEEAKRLYETANAEQRYVLESLFPELKESEDEKVRKELIDYFKENNAALAFRGISNECILAWLEKQGRHKPTDKIEPENTPIEGKFPYNNSSDTLEDEIENIWGKLSCQGLFTATKEGFSEVATHFANYLKKQKPAEWSVEDERMRNNLIELLIRLSANTRTDSTSINRSYPREIDWLKNLKPQPKQEWSEEDERMIISIANHLEKQKNYQLNKTNIEQCQEWLKSLKPQKQWKPSEEQIDAIHYVVQHYNPNACERLAWDSLKTLEIMYNDLKKLIG